MEGSWIASSFQLPTGDDSRYPSWVLLDKVAYFALPDKNARIITKKIKTSTGEEVEISFSLADPPAVSYLCVYSP
jgi:hypothetical protein